MPEIVFEVVSLILQRVKRLVVSRPAVLPRQSLAEPNVGGMPSPATRLQAAILCRLLG